MRHAIAIWNYAWALADLPEAIRTFAGYGFDTISFHPGQFKEATEANRKEIRAELDRLDLAATVHGDCNLDRDTASTLVQMLGDRLQVFSFDTAMTEDSCGRFYDAQRIAATGELLLGLTEGTRARVAVEDFPLDAEAQARYGVRLAPLWAHARFGILADLGHMHLRRTQFAIFRAHTVAEYFQRLPLPLVEIHVHDNPGDRDAHAPLGSGTLPVEEVARALGRIGFAGVSTIEIAPSFHGDTPAASRPKAEASLARWHKLMDQAG